MLIRLLVGLMLKRWPGVHDVLMPEPFPTFSTEPLGERHCSTHRENLAMPLTAYVPKDLERYKKHPDSVLFSAKLKAGQYVFVQDIDGRVWVAPDGCHVHPRVLGRARPVVAAGELTLEDQGAVQDINNLSGTFQCHPDCLFTVVGGQVDALLVTQQTLSTSLFYRSYKVVRSIVEVVDVLS